MFLHHCSHWANVWPVVTALGKDLINILAVLEIGVHCLNYIDSSILEVFLGSGKLQSGHRFTHDIVMNPGFVFPVNNLTFLNV